MAVPTSWVPGAADPDTDFPLQNLPLCVFRPPDAPQVPRIGVGIGRSVLDLQACADRQLLPLPAALRDACRGATLNALIALGRPAMRELRSGLHALLVDGAPQREPVLPLLRPQAEVRFGLPVAVGDYTDFLASYQHAFNVGSLYRPGQPVLPNFASMPIAYHGRASSLLVSGEPVFRPWGQFRARHDADEIVHAPTRRLDIEVELGAFVGVGNRRGHPIPVTEAPQHLAGLCLLNDWSARDIQAWESQPLGPFQGKNFATSISPWLVTLEALEPYRVAAAARPSEHPPLAAHLREPAEGAGHAYPVHVQARLSTQKMRREGLAEQLVAESVFSRDSYWTFSQMVAQHTANGCNLRPGDLLGSGTISGPDPGSEGSLLERTRGGAQPLELPGGETRTFLADGDEVVLSAFCIAPGLPRIGFGECRARVLPAPTPTPQPTMP